VRVSRHPGDVNASPGMWSHGVFLGKVVCFAKTLRFRTSLSRIGIMPSQIALESRSMPSQLPEMQKILRWGMELPVPDLDVDPIYNAFPPSSQVPSNDDIPPELKEVPFAGLVWTWTSHFVHSQAPIDQHGICEPSVHRQIKHELARRIGRLLEEPLLAAFNEFRRGSKQTQFSPNRSDLFERFQQQLLGDPRPFFRMFEGLNPVLQRLQSLFIAGIRRLMKRLDTDTSDLQRQFGIAGKVYSLELGLSDPHNGQQSVVILTFTNGRRIVYKPRELQADQTLNQVIEYAARLIGCHLKTFSILRRTDYGWCEFVTADPCSSMTEVREYAHRAGILLCITHVLAMTDGHLENVIACGPHPVLVDGETIMTGRAKPMDPETNYADNPANQMIDESVCRTGFVPRWDIDDSSKSARDISGFGGRRGIAGRSRLPRVMDPNTDAMRVELCETDDVEDRVANLPNLDGVRVDLYDHVDEVIAGFTAAYQRLSHLTPGETSELLGMLDNCTTRFVFRNTAVYWAIRNESQKAISMRSQEARVAVIFNLAKPFVECVRRPHSLNVLQEEIEAMLKGDVPYFQTRSNSTDLFRCDGTVVCQDFLEESGIEKVRGRLGTLSQSDLQLQTAILRSAFAALQSGLAPPVDDGVRGEANHTQTGMPKLTVESSDHTNALGGGILNSIHWTESRVPLVISCKYVASVSRFQIAPMGWSLYDGQMGVMLALASMERATSDDRYGHALRAMFHQLAERVHRPVSRVAKSLVEEIGIGGYLGVGSVLYGLTAIARKDPTYREMCQGLVNVLLDSISETHIESDTTLDLLGGTAGLACALACCVDEFQPTRGRLLAQACAAKLTRSASDTPLGGKAWRGVEPLPLGGLSHGASGIMLALARLYRLLGDESLLETASAGMEFETQLLESSETNWKDLRGVTDWSAVSQIRNSQSSWCHGAPGILLNRLEWSRVLPTRFAWTSQLDHALRHLASSPCDGPDHLCCGEIGCIQVLQRAADVLGEAAFATVASQRRSSLVARSISRGGYRLLPAINDNLLHLGYFQGISGILHALMDPVECGNALVLSLD
jgi:type 2 lantibiotic biosynthesis protein LanM